MSRSEQPRDLKTLVFLSFFAQFFFGGEVNDNEKNAIGMVVSPILLHCLLNLSCQDIAVNRT